MNLHRMTVDQLLRGVREAATLAGEIGHHQPDAAKLILDGIELWTEEILVHALQGDRAVAAKIHQQMIRAKDG